MPVTPFHVGPGLMLKAVAPRHFSLSTFIAVNVAIDLEPITWFLLTGDPVHGLLHTAVGASALALVGAGWGRLRCEGLSRWWNAALSPAQARWLAVAPAMAPRAALAGALLGAWSHVGLDALMHVDVRPLWPAAVPGGIVGWLDIDRLHLLCALLGLAGAARLALVRWRQRMMPPSRVP